MNQRNARNGIEAKQQPPLAFGRQKERNVEKKMKQNKKHSLSRKVSARECERTCSVRLLTSVCTSTPPNTEVDEQVNWTMCVSFAFCICLFPFRVINCISLQKRTGDRTPAVICRFRQIHWAVICYVRARACTRTEIIELMTASIIVEIPILHEHLSFICSFHLHLSRRSDHFQNEQKICGFYFNFVCICNWHVALLFHSHLARRHRAILGHFFPRHRRRFFPFGVCFLISRPNLIFAAEKLSFISSDREQWNWLMAKYVEVKCVQLTEISTIFLLLSLVTFAIQHQQQNLLNLD